MRSLLFIFIACITFSKIYAQCNTTLNKLLPESAVNNNDRYGSAIAATDQYLVVAAENSDSLGVLYGGAAFLYEKTPAGWAYRAMFKPSDPTTYDFFGNDVEIDATGNTVFIINRGYPKGTLYIFEKSNSGWETMTETSRIEFPDSFEWTSTVNIKSDESKLVIGSANKNSPKFYVLAKAPTGWIDTLEPEIIIGPPSEFGIDILLHGEYLYASADNDDSGNGIYVYKSQGASYQYIAKLSISTPFGSIGYFGRSLTATDDMVATMGAFFLPNDPRNGYQLFIFKKTGEWINSTETINTNLPLLNNLYRFPFPITFLSPTELVASIMVKEDDSYTGKVFLTTATNNTWQHMTSTVLQEKKGLPSTNDFSLNMVWNGSELIRSVEMKEMGFANRDAVMSLTRSGNSWGSQQEVTLPRYNSSDFNFGLAVHKVEKTLFTGSPYDGTVGKGAGTVYVYEKSGDEFIRKNVIVPSPRKVRSTGGSDAGFGYSIASSSNDLAIGAPSYLYSTGLYGKIFLYKRATSSWQSLVLYDSVSAPPELQLNHIGTAVAMNDHYLFASAYNNFNGEHTSAIVIYEKVSGKWQFQQVIKLGKPIDKSWPPVKLSLSGDQLMVGSYFTIGGGVSMLSKNLTNGNWEIKTFFEGGIFSGYGADVKLFENHFFVGAPGYAYEGVAKSGAVLVYAKLPGQEWNSLMEPVAIIGAKVPIEGGYFGSSVDVIGNTLAVGAPGKFLDNDNQVRTVPGNTYIIQTQDYFWQTTTEFLNLQGDRYAANERDYFGSDVGIDEEYFYIGSSSEHTARGSFSGAAYYIPTPPVIFLHAPVCETTSFIQLQAYPFGGTWSGSGVNASGKFNPASVGIGSFTLTYTSPNCSNEGKVLIEVKEPTIITQLTPANVTLCSEDITLQVSSQPGTLYEWYYKSETGDTFHSLGMSGSQKPIGNTGQYFARLNQGVCMSDSPIFHVSIEGITLSIGPQEIVCTHDQILPLKISINSGTWSGTGVKDGMFNSSNLTNGTYQVSYRFSSPLGCDITVKDSVQIKVIEPVSITRTQEDYCETGSALLQSGLSGNSNLITYSWYFAAREAEVRTAIQRPLGSSATVFEPGYYHVEVSNENCKVVSGPVEIGFETDLEYRFLPEEDTQICDQEKYDLEVSAREETDYQWFYKPNDADLFEEIGNGIENQFSVKKSGLYKVIGRYGFCSFESDTVNIKFANDSIFVPNVFTPNGDADNQYFKVLTNTKVASIAILNRYGRNVFTVSGNHPWDGGDMPSGIYYWLVQYQSCSNTRKELKGWVQLIR